jgi:hypothetical protein
MKERKIFEIIKHLNKLFVELLPEKNVIISVVDIKLSQRGGKLKIWLSVFPESKEDEVIKFLRVMKKKIKDSLRVLRLRYLPKDIEIYSSSLFKEAGEVIKFLEEMKNEIEKENKEKEG